MKKLIKSLRMSLIILATFAVALVSCSKNESGGGGSTGGGPTVLLPKSPDSLILKAVDTALYAGNAKATVATDGQAITTSDPQALVVGKTITFYNLTEDRVVTITATNSNEAGSASKSITVIIKRWSQKTTQLQGYAPLHMTFSKSCIAGTENDPNTIWYDGIIDPAFWIRFFANGGAQTNSWTYSAGKGWAWADTQEKSIAFGIDANGNLSEIWNVTLLPNGFDRSHVDNGFYILQKFR